MTTPILATKLYIPPPRPEIVLRPRLIERLNEGLHQNRGMGRKLTLISAPAGFGKTSLVSSWIYDLRFTTPDVLPSGVANPSEIVNPKSKTQNQIAWLSLDEGDNDLPCFLTYLVAAVQTIAPEIGAGALAALQSPQLPPAELILTGLLNEIVTLPDNFLLVFDDYHVIEAQPVDAALAFLLEHLPAQMHLVIATRETPAFPLARLRARNQLLELRAADLRFTPAEAADFLNRVMGLALAAEDVAALETRTEGWIAGLQLAALSMRGRADAAGFIKSFTGSHHFVLDYLVEEVLRRQPENVQTFLLRTSILNRLCGPLCNAVMGDPAVAGQETLEYLERANLFIVPLDNERHWYRYHHLFAGFLQQRLRQNPPALLAPGEDRLAELHNRASRWYEANSYEAEAFHHAVAAGNFSRAAGLAELTWQAMDDNFQSAAWLGRVKKLPDEVIRTRPVLCTQVACALMDAGQMEASEARLREAERWLDTTEDSANGMVIVDEAMFQTLPARIALTRAYNAQAQADFPGTVKYAELALELCSEDDLFSYGAAVVLLGMANWACGNLASAQQAMTDWINGMRKAGKIVFAIASISYLADVMVAQGRLHEAAKTYRQSLQLAAEQNPPVWQMTANAHLGLGLIYYEQGNEQVAAQYLQKSRDLGNQTTLVDWPYRLCLAQARLKEAEGNLEAALDLLDEARRLYVRIPVPDTHPIDALMAHVYARQGKLTEAQAWVRERNLSVADDLSYIHEFEHITLSRVLMAGYKSTHAEHFALQATELLARLLKAAEEGERTGSQIQILVLLALTHEAQGNIAPALVSLDRALILAEPEGYVRIFVDEGLPMAALLQEAAKRGIVPAYVNQLRAAFAKTEDKTPGVQPLLEPLSERELEVLKLFKTDLNGPEIARELTVSLNTLRTHTKNIYAKLGVNNRRAALHRAEELNLL